MKKVLVIIICFFAFPCLIHAECTNAELNEATSLASNVNVMYEVSIDNDVPKFSITLTNLTNDMILIESGTGKTYRNHNQNIGEFNIVTSQSGAYRFSIYSYKCKTQVATKTLNLPSYNPYYKDSLCQGLEQYSQCQRWSGYSATREKFEEDIATIRNNIEKTNQQQQSEKPREKSIYEKIQTLFFKYWWLIVIVLVVISFVYYSIRSYQKKNEYDFKL